MIPLLLMNLLAYSQIELKPITIIKNDTLYFSFTEWQFREVIKKKLKLSFLEKENITINERLKLTQRKFKNLEEINRLLNSDLEALKSLLIVKDEIISNNSKIADNTLKIVKKQNKILKITGVVLVVLFLVK